MPNKYKHDTERWLRSQASLYRACHNREVAEKFVLCADEVKRLKAELAEWQEKASEHADNSASATTELIGLRGELAALKEAVAWERECEEIRTWLIMTRRYPNKTSARWELYDEFYCARAEVDRLIAEREG